MIQLVTGATGLIGGHLVRRLSERGVPVRAVVRRRGESGRADGGLAVRAGLPDGVELVEAELDDAGSLERAMRGVSHVFHCAGLVSDWGPSCEFHRANVEGTRRVVDAALAQGVRRFVHMSSAAVHGYRGKRPFVETSPRCDRGIPYIASKIAAEKVVLEAIRTRGLHAVMLRPVMVFGPGSKHYVAEIARHLRDGSMILVDGGRHVAGLSYVENVVDACELAAVSDAPPGSAWSICDDSDVTWGEYIARLAAGIDAPSPRWSLPSSLLYPLAVASELAGRAAGRRERPLLTRMAVLELGTEQRYDIRRARDELGYRPRIDFETAMERTIRWANEQAKERP